MVMPQVKQVVDVANAALHYGTRITFTQMLATDTTVTAQRGLRNGYASNIGRHEMRVPERMCGGQLQTRHEMRRVHADEAAARDLAEAADEARSRAHRAHQAASNREAREAGHERAVERVT